jgi:glucose 1-dehydrogenase
MKEKLLFGQKALVTGANSGIGEAVAKALAGEGAAVVVNYVSKPDDAERVVDEIRAAGGEAMAIRADVRDEAQVRAMFAVE